MANKIKEATLFNQIILDSLNESNVDFIAEATSYWHAIGVDSFVLDFAKTRRQKINGIIIIIPHLKNGIILDEKDFSCRNIANIKFYYMDVTIPSKKKMAFRIYDFSKRLIQITLSTRNLNSYNPKRSIYLVSINNIDWKYIILFCNKELSIRYFPIFIIVDEGIGTYLSKNVWNLINDYPEAKILKMFLPLFKQVIGIFEKLMLSNIYIDNRFMFKKEKNRLVPNFSLVNSYKSSIILRKQTVSLSKNLNSSDVLLITQPFSEYDQITLEDELRILEDTINYILQIGLRVVIKPHPRENLDKYKQILENFPGISLIDQKSPVEAHIINNEPACVIGYTSTSLVNATVLFNIKAISIIDIILENSNDKLLQISSAEFKILSESLGVIFINDLKKFMDIEM